MPFDDSCGQPGDHREVDADDRETIVANVRERQAVTGNNVRYVLLVGIASIVILFALFLVFELSKRG